MAEKWSDEKKAKYARARRVVAREKQQQVAASALNVLPIAGSAYNASQAKKGRGVALFGRNMGRKFVEQSIASTPGAVLGGIGGATGKPGLVRLGSGISMVTRPTAAWHSGGAAMKNAQKRKDVKIGKGLGMSISAFGVDHGAEEISKLSLAPLKSAVKGLKFGNATSAPRAAAAGYKSAIKGGATKTQASIKGAYNFARRSPGAALGVAGVGATGVGGAGYLAGRRRD